MIRKDDIMLWLIAGFVFSTAVAIFSNNAFFELLSFVSGISLGALLVWDNFTK